LRTRVALSTTLVWRDKTATTSTAFQNICYPNAVLSSPKPQQRRPVSIFQVRLAGGALKCLVAKNLIPCSRSSAAIKLRARDQGNLSGCPELDTSGRRPAQSGPIQVGLHKHTHWPTKPDRGVSCERKCTRNRRYDRWTPLSPSRLRRRWPQRAADCRRMHREFEFRPQKERR
jgi:hypothetical protein